MSEIKVTIDLNKPFLGLDGKPFKDLHGRPLSNANLVVGNFLFNSHSQDKSDRLRNSVWAHKLQEEGKITVDKKELDAILTICGNAGMLDGLWCQLSEWFDGYKEEWDRLKEESKREKAVEQG